MLSLVIAIARHFGLLHCFRGEVVQKETIARKTIEGSWLPFREGEKPLAAATSILSETKSSATEAHVTQSMSSTEMGLTRTTHSRNRHQNL